MKAILENVSFLHLLGENTQIHKWEDGYHLYDKGVAQLVSAIFFVVSLHKQPISLETFIKIYFVILKKALCRHSWSDSVVSTDTTSVPGSYLSSQQQSS